MIDLLEDQEFKRLESKYPFLSHAREHFSGLEKERFVIVDIETTGLDFSTNEIIEVAAMKVENKEIIDVFDSLIDPNSEISPEITRITGITQDMVEGHPKISDISSKILEFFGDAILIAHNSSFDIPFLKHHLKKNFNNQIVCTLKASRYLLPNLANHKLHTVAAHFGVTAQNRHRALGDVETTLQVWLNMIPLLRDKGIYAKQDLQKIPG